MNERDKAGKAYSSKVLSKLDMVNTRLAVASAKIACALSNSLCCAVEFNDVTRSCYGVKMKVKSCTCDSASEYLNSQEQVEYELPKQFLENQHDAIDLVEFRRPEKKKKKKVQSNPIQIQSNLITSNFEVL